MKQSVEGSDMIRSLTMSVLVMVSAVFLGLLLPSSVADDVLYGGNALNSGQSLDQGGYSLIIQPDCNLELYDNDQMVWSTGTNGLGSNCILGLQTDGNLVILDGNSNLVWQSNTGGPQGYYVLILQPDRNIVIYGCPSWTSGTNIANSEGVVVVKNDRNDTSSPP